MTKNELINLIVNLIPSLIAWWCYKNLTVSSEKQYLTFWPRLWAGFVDSLVLWPLAFVFTLTLQLDIPLWLSIIVWFLQSLIWVAYSVYMHGKYGQTIGKIVTKVKIIDAKTHNPVSFRHAIVRDSIPILIIIILEVYWVYHLATGTISIDTLTNGESWTGTNHESWLGAGWFLLIFAGWYLAEIITMLTNDKRRALHDFLAGTVVVRTNIEKP